MAHSTNAQRSPDEAGSPRAAQHAFSPYTLAFDEFAEPRTIPALWDLSSLLVLDGWSNGRDHRKAGEGLPTDRSEG